MAQGRASVVPGTTLKTQVQTQDPQHSPSPLYLLSRGHTAPREGGALALDAEAFQAVRPTPLTEPHLKHTLNPPVPATGADSPSTKWAQGPPGHLPRGDAGCPGSPREAPPAISRPGTQVTATAGPASHPPGCLARKGRAGRRRRGMSSGAGAGTPAWPPLRWLHGHSVAHTSAPGERKTQVRVETWAPTPTAPPPVTAGVGTTPTGVHRCGGRIPRGAGRWRVRVRIPCGAPAPRDALSSRRSDRQVRGGTQRASSCHTRAARRERPRHKIPLIRPEATDRKQPSGCGSPRGRGGAWGSRPRRTRGWGGLPWG